LAQDIEMIESEQQNYSANPNGGMSKLIQRIIAIQRLIVRQYEQFVQKSSQTARQWKPGF
jgi:flagellar biosynthesis chaperone FliJ